ncbi:peptidase S1 [Laceyella sacchari]|uniref:Serine protease Do n=1 Tax=Laceyella sediminis TaxID=573074 RepID=A0ABX5ESW4_9BACL|nr:trypsin-like peptidase domain-containing protein [Laceyella sediminis]AUS10278.1 peptidase S1 [Laceyella sacchari]PRZ16587.1 serine protease Do [Laceyella sediminis]
MGYYDEQPDYKQPKRSASPIFTSIVSAIIGGLIVLLLSPSLTRMGLLPSVDGNLPQTTVGNKQVTSVKVNSDITSAVKKAAPAVVGVINLKRSFNFFETEELQQSSGSGIIFEKIDGKARIITNYHVIQGGSRFKVIIPNGNDKNQEVEARLLGGDQLTDLAVLEISDKYVTAIADLGNSDQLTAGEPAIAIGNPLGLGQSVTTGVISSPKRAFKVDEQTTTDVIQTDAAINPGNSGGALINISGQVIGINTLKIAEQGVEGLGFAIPINDARPIVEKLIKYGKVSRPYLGVQMVDVADLTQEARQQLNLPNNITSGVALYELEPGSPADQAGMEPGDVITALDGQIVKSGSDIRQYMYTKKAVNDKMEVTYFRNGKKQTATITLGEAPSNLR